MDNDKPLSAETSAPQTNAELVKKLRSIPRQDEISLWPGSADGAIGWNAALDEVERILDEFVAAQPAMPPQPKLAKIMYLFEELGFMASQVERVCEGKVELTFDIRELLRGISKVRDYVINQAAAMPPQESARTCGSCGAWPGDAHEKECGAAQDERAEFEKTKMEAALAFIASAAKHFSDPATSRCQDCTAKLLLYEARAARVSSAQENA